MRRGSPRTPHACNASKAAAAGVELGEGTRNGRTTRAAVAAAQTARISKSKITHTTSAGQSLVSPRQTTVKARRLNAVFTGMANLNGSRQQVATPGVAIMPDDQDQVLSHLSSLDSIDEDLSSGCNDNEYTNGTDAHFSRTSSSSETEDSDSGVSHVIRCIVCRRGNRSAEMVLCDHCDSGVHLGCHDPPMHAVPEHDFFCPQCCASAGYSDSLDGCIPSTLAQVSLVVGELVDNVITLCWRRALAPGDRCDALDRTGNWYSSRVVQVRQCQAESGAECLIHFDGWSTRLDEWLPIDSDCLQMLGSQDRSVCGTANRRKGTKPRNYRHRPVRTPPVSLPEKRQRVKPTSTLEIAKKKRTDLLPLVDLEKAWEDEASIDIRQRLGLKASVLQRRNPLQPFCLFENVANMPKGEVDRATEQLKMPFTVVNSGDISAANRLRCYWSNSGFPPEFSRKDLEHSPALCIGDFVGKQTLRTLKWPEWDRSRLQSKFRVVHTKSGTDKMNSINRLIDRYGVQSLENDSETQDLISRNNLIWTAHGNLRCLTTGERERLLGFPEGYTSGFTMSVQSSMLGESFHIGTITHLLRPVVAQMPQVPVILSLFDGIGGAKLALKRCGVEMNLDCQRLMRMHWDDAKDGMLVQLADVRDLAAQDDVLGALQKVVGLGEISIDLCIGGWPCNNLSGYNRATGRNGRRGLDGSKSSLLFPLSEVVTQLCSQPFFGTCASDVDTLPPMTQVAVVQKRQQYRATVIESVRRRQPAACTVGSALPSADGLWYRVRFTDSLPTVDYDASDMWLPASAVFTSESFSTSADQRKTPNLVSDATGTSQPLCAGCLLPNKEPHVLHCCQSCFKHWHGSCMADSHPAAAQYWEAPTDIEVEVHCTADLKQHWFCHECMHPIPSSRAKDGPTRGRSSTRSSEDPDEIACVRCRRLDDAEQMILCDGCDNGFHLFCLDPPLKIIPDGDWLCPHCCVSCAATNLDGLHVTHEIRDLNGPVDAPVEEHHGSLSLSAADQKEIELVVLQLTTTVQRASWRESLSIGDKCVCIDVNRIWYEARVVGIRGGGKSEQYVGNATAGRYLVPHYIDTVAKTRGSSKQLLIHFAGWHKQWDEWVSVFSDRIQPAGTQCLKQSHRTAQPHVASGSAPGVNQTARGQYAARRLANVLCKQRGAVTPIFEPEGLALEAELLAEQQWGECRRFLCIRAQVEAVVGVLIRTVEQNCRLEQRVRSPNATLAAAQALKTQRAAQLQRRQTERDEKRRLKLIAAQQREDQKIARAVASVLKRLVGRVVAHVRSADIAAQRAIREREHEQKRIIHAARRQEQQKRQQAAVRERAVRAVLFNVVAEVEKQRERDSRQEAQVSRILQTILGRVEKILSERPTLAFALSRGWLRVGQYLDVLWDEEPPVDNTQQQLPQPVGVATSSPGRPQWYAAKILALPPMSELMSSEWQGPLTLSYPVDDTEYEEENLFSWEEVKHIECRLRTTHTETSGRTAPSGAAKRKSKDRVGLSDESPCAKRSRPVVQPAVTPLVAGESATMTVTAHFLMVDEIRVLRRRNEMLQAELRRLADSGAHVDLRLLGQSSYTK